MPGRSGETNRELVAFLLMTVGSIVPVLGWLVGVVVLWTSRWLTRNEKLLASLVVPGGPFAALILGLAVLALVSIESNSGVSALFVIAVILVVLAVVAPIVLAVVLFVRARRRAAA